MSVPTGKVFLIGAGPGDPGLITVKGKDRLEAADVVVYDYLANPALLSGLPDTVERIYVGKRHGDHLLSQEKINALLVERARAGKTVARLKGGDPFIFGRGGEEALALTAAEVPFEVVPGVTAATAVAAYAGIPLTHRGMNATVTFVTGSEDPSRNDTLIHWNDLAKTGGTLVFFMGVKSLPDIARRLVAEGRAPDTPAAVIQWGTHPCQRTVTGTVSNIAEKVSEANIVPPALIVVGDVVAMRESINWFETLPLFGRRVLVTRARGQQGALAQALSELGAEVVQVPTLKFVPPDDPAPLDEAIDHLTSYHWLVLTSANGVRAFFERLAHHGKDARALAGIQVATVGSESARVLAQHGVEADLVPADARAEGLAAALIEHAVHDQKVLVVQAQKARRVLPQMLVAQGVSVDMAAAYKTVCPDPDEIDLTPLIDGPPPDYACFTSSSTVTNLRTLLGPERFAGILSGSRIAVIGPVTRDTCDELGLTVHITSKSPSVEALAAAIAADTRQQRETS
ncbi:MAG: uroporphyrinogen-III C-methyltransferase [Leptospirillia bacterium]